MTNITYERIDTVDFGGSLLKKGGDLITNYIAVPGKKPLEIHAVISM